MRRTAVSVFFAIAGAAIAPLQAGATVTSPLPAPTTQAGTPLNNGEGAILAGPNGTAYGVGWDAYSGDHLQGFRYTPNASGGVWEVSELPLHTPFFDRPWLTYVKGGSLLISGGGTGED